METKRIKKAACQRVQKQRVLLEWKRFISARFGSSVSISRFWKVTTKRQRPTTEMPHSKKGSHARREREGCSTIYCPAKPSMYVSSSSPHDPFLSRIVVVGVTSLVDRFSPSETLLHEIQHLAGGNVVHPSVFPRVIRSNRD